MVTVSTEIFPKKKETFLMGEGPLSNSMLVAYRRR